MPRPLLPALLLAAVFSPPAALAAAHAEVAVAGDAGIDLHLRLSTGGADVTYQFFTVDLDPLQTVSRTFTYTVVVADDGLPATRTTTLCTPDYLSDCGPDPTGYEQAYALIELGRDRRATDENNFYVDDTGFQQSFHSVSGSPHTYTGTITYTATDTSPYVPQHVELSVLLYALVDAAPVPEPAGWSLAALGLLPWLARARRGGVSR